MGDRNPIRLGIIGAGFMGRKHAEGVLSGKVPDMCLAGICDRKGVDQAGLEGVEVFSNTTEMTRSGRVDAVLITTPHYSHTSIGIECLEAGLHVLVEKPISVHKADCERLIAAHRDPRQVFAAMFNQRTDPRYRKLKAMIEGGDLGMINRVNWTITDWFRPDSYYANGEWRATWAGEGGGVLLNQAPHQLDLWQWLFGMPHKVRAFCRNGHYHDIEVEDDVTAYMEYDGGMTGTFITSTGEAPGTNRLEIAAEHGRVIVEGSSITWSRNLVDSTSFLRRSDDPFAKPPTEETIYTFDSEGEQHLGILRNFATAILEGEALIAPAAEGIRSVELANAMIHSSETGGTIKLPLDGEAYETSLLAKIKDSGKP